MRIKEILRLSKMVLNRLINIQILKTRKFALSDKKKVVLLAERWLYPTQISFFTLPNHIQLLVSETDPSRQLTSLH
jgi:hypothetical protein